MLLSDKTDSKTPENRQTPQSLLNQTMPASKIEEYVNVKFTPTISDQEIAKKIDDFDSKLIGHLVKLYQGMTGTTMDLEKVENAITALQQFNSSSEYFYLNNLLHPEKEKGVKLPSPIPVPSSAFQMHNSVTLSTNSSGNLGIVFNPFFLYRQEDFANTVLSTTESSDDPVTLNYLSTLWVNNSDTLTGANPDTNFKAINIGQGIPGVYDQYRLVSASVILRYIGRLDAASGVAGGAIVFDETQVLGAKFTSETGLTAYSAGSNLAKYGNFDLAMDSYYHQENLALEGIRELYFPLDNSYEEYVSLFTKSFSSINLVAQQGTSISGQVSCTEPDIYKTGFNYMLYVLGAPPNTNCFKLDIFCNFECLPTPQFLNYMPVSPPAPCISQQIKRDSISEIQKNSVAKADQEIKIMKPPSIWKKLKTKFGNSLPNIMKFATGALKSAIPNLDVGLSLAGALLNANRMDIDA